MVNTNLRRALVNRAYQEVGHVVAAAECDIKIRKVAATRRFG